MCSSDQVNRLCSISFAPGELKLAKISDITKQILDGHRLGMNKRYLHLITIIACDWVVFAATDEWIWTFTEYNWMVMVRMCRVQRK